MNIESLGNSDYIYSVNGRQNQANARRETSNTPDNGDTLAAPLSARIRESLEAVPEVRPEVVERGRQLLADPGYPSQDIVNKIAGMITPFSED